MVINQDREPHRLSHTVGSGRARMQLGIPIFRQIEIDDCVGDAVGNLVRMTPETDRPEKITTTHGLPPQMVLRFIDRRLVGMEKHDALSNTAAQNSSCSDRPMVMARERALRIERTSRSAHPSEAQLRLLFEKAAA